MKLYDGGRAPNPRRVRIFLAEKGIVAPTEQVDLGKLQQRGAAYTAINPMQRVPALLLDDGTVIAESIAICRYFEALQPEPALFGQGALEGALVEMWNRRVEHNLLFAVTQVFRHLHAGDIGRNRFENAAEFRIAIGFRIERIHLADAALQEEVDDGNILLRLGGHGVTPREIAPRQNRANLEKTSTVELRHRVTLLSGYT